MVFSINLNAKHVKGMTPFDLVRLLDTLVKTAFLRTANVMKCDKDKHHMNFF